MEKNQYTEKKYKSFSEIIRDSLRILKANILMYFGLFILIALIIGAMGWLQYMMPENVLLNNLVSILNLLGGGVIAILYIGTAYNTLYPHKTTSIINLMKCYIIPMLLTQLLLSVAVFLPIFILFMILTLALTSTGGFGMMPLIGVILLIIVFTFAIRFSFLPQSIVLSEQKYWAAIKWSWQKTSGFGGMIFAIWFIPAIIAFLCLFLFIINNMYLEGIIITALLSSVISIISTLAISVFYIDVVLEEKTEAIEQVPIENKEF